MTITRGRPHLQPHVLGAVATGRRARAAAPVAAAAGVVVKRRRGGSPQARHGVGVQDVRRFVREQDRLPPDAAPVGARHWRATGASVPPAADAAGRRAVRERLEGTADGCEARGGRRPTAAAAIACRVASAGAADGSGPRFPRRRRRKLALAFGRGRVAAAVGTGIGTGTRGSLAGRLRARGQCAAAPAG